MTVLFRLCIVLLALLLISCGSSSDDTSAIPTGSNTSNTDTSDDGDNSYSPGPIAGIKTLAADYSAFSEPEDIPIEEIPVEKMGFITMNASSDGDIIIAGAAHGKLYYSDNGGIAWYTLEGIGVKAYWSGSTVSADGQDIAVVAQGLYVSHDSGDTWTEYPFEEGYDAYSKLAMSDDGSTIAMYSEYNFNISHDYGETWMPPSYSSSNSLFAVDVSADGQKIGALYSGEVFRLSEDGGTTWVDTASGKEAWTDMDMSPDGMVIALLTHGQIDEFGDENDKWFDVYLSFDGGKSWNSTTVEGEQAATSIAITNDGEKVLVSFITTDDPFILSEDSGVTWKAIPTPEKENPDWPQYTHVFSNNGNRIVAMERAYSIWTSDDLGQTWIKRLIGQGAEGP